MKFAVGPSENDNNATVMMMITQRICAQKLILKLVFGVRLLYLKGGPLAQEDF